jgi:hypothetical protein
MAKTRASGADEEVVAVVWRRLYAGARYDAPAALPLVAPRPLLITNGAVDPRCPQEVSPAPCCGAQRGGGQSTAAERP